MEQEQAQVIGKSVIDASSVLTTVAALMGWLPAIAAVLTIIWTAIRIWETKTVQRLVNPPKTRRRTDKS